MPNNESHSHILVDGTDRLQKAYDLAFGSVHAEGLHHKPVQRFEINLGDRCVCSGRDRVDETLERVLGDDNLINYNLSD